MGRKNIRNQQPNERGIAIRTTPRDIRVTAGARLETSAGPAALVFLHPIPGQVTHLHRQTSTVHLHQKFNASFLTVHNRIESAAALLSRRFERTVETSIERFARTLTVRTQRIEAGRKQTERTVTFSSHATVVQPQMVVLRRVEPPRTIEHVEHRNANGDRQPQGAPIDLGLLTNQVMSAIDGRITAMRERLGRR